MDILIVILVLLLSNYIWFGAIRSANQSINTNYCWLLFLVHIVLTLVYIVYAFQTTSDSFAYFETTQATASWLSLFGSGTTFIKFLAWPFVSFFGLSYLATMVLFSYFGFIGILLFYLAAKENTYTDDQSGKYSIAEYIFLLPNIHFWSSSLGKGSIIIMALGLFFFGLSRFNRRWLIIPAGALLAYFVRPHIFLATAIGLVFGIVFTARGVKGYMRFLIVAAALLLIYGLSDNVMEFTETDSLNIFNSNTITRRAAELGKSSTGIDISNYNIAAKLFTFWFRPLFVDANGLMGLFVSVENVFYLYMFGIIIFALFKKKNELNGWYYICIITFLLCSVVLAQVSGNLGIALRQKAQLMPLVFVFYCKVVSLKQRENDYQLAFLN